MRERVFSPLAIALMGKLGMKTGEGFYKWTPQSAKKTLARYERALLDALALLKRHKGG